MPRNTDLNVRILGSFDGQPAFKSAEASANAMARALDKLEQKERALANAQIAAARENEQRAKDAQEAAMSLGETIGKVSIAGGAALAAGLGLATKAAMDWQSAWVGVEKTVNGNAEQMGVLEDQLRELARTLPSTHEEIAGVAEAAGQLGVKRQDIASFTKTMIDLGQSTNLTADEAATSLAQLMNIMGTAPQDVGRLGAALVALGNDGASTESDILAMAMRIAGAGKTIGLTEAQVLSLSNALASVGIDAEAGGSAISRVMIDMAKAVEEGGDKLDGFAEVAGMSSQQFRQAWQENAAGALDSFITGLGRMQATGRSTFKTLDDLGFSQIRVRDTLLRAANAGDLLSASLQTGNQAWQDNTALVQEASKRYETAESKIAIARNQLNDAAIDMGATLLPAISAVAERGGTLAEVFRELPGPVKQGVTILGSLAATASIAGGAVLLLIPKIAALRTTLESMGTRGARGLRALNATTSVLGGPWGVALAAGAIAAVAFGNAQLKAKAHVDDLRESLDQQTGAMTQNTRAAVAKALQESGAFDIAKRLGVSLQDVAAAAIGEADAQNRLAQARLAAAQASHQPNTPELLEWQQLTEKIGDQSGALAKSRQEWQDRQLAMGGTTSSEQSAQGAIDGTTGALNDQQQSAEEAEQAIKDLKNALDVLNGVHLSARAAARDFEQAIDDAAKSLKDNGKSLDINTQKGRDNQAALDGIASKANDLAKAILDETGSEAMMRESLADSRADLIKTARRFGMSKDEAKKYADAVLSIPAEAETNVDVNGVAHALTQIQALERALKNIKGRTVDVVVNRKIAVQNDVLTGSTRRASGGYVPPSAGAGPRADDVPILVSGGEYVVQASAVSKYGVAVFDAMNAGRFAGGGQVRGGANEQIIAALGQDLGAQVVKAFADGMGGEKGTVKSVAEQIRSIVTDSAKKASDDLKSLLDEQASYASRVSGAFLSAGSLTGAPEGGQSFTVGPDGVMRENTASVAYRGRLLSAIGQTKNFTATIRQLQKLGLRTDILQQFLDAGPDSASAAAALVGLGKSGIADVNALQGQLVGATTGLGTLGAQAVYGSRVAAARSQVADAKVLEVAVSRATAAQVAELKKVTAEGRATNLALSKLAGQFAAALKDAGRGVQVGARNAVAR